MKILRGLSVTHSIASFGVERVIEAKTVNGGQGWGDKASLHTYLIIGLVSSCGGAMLAEIANFLLLPRRVYKRPAFTGVPAGMAIGIIGTLLYVFVIRNPTGLAPSSVLVGICEMLNRFLGASWFAVPSTLAKSLDFFWPEAAMGKATAVALLSLVVVPLHLVSADAVEAALYRFLSAVVPGFRAVIYAPEMSKSGPPASVFGYRLTEPEVAGVHDDEDPENDAMIDEMARAAVEEEEAESGVMPTGAAVFAAAAEDDEEEEAAAPAKKRKEKKDKKPAASTPPRAKSPASAKASTSSVRSRSRK